MNGVDKLTGELADIAKELSKAIPKGYAELVREYQASFISMLTVSIVLLIVLGVATFFVAKDFVKKTKKLTTVYIVPNSVTPKEANQATVCIIATLNKNNRNNDKIKATKTGGIKSSFALFP